MYNPYLSQEQTHQAPSPPQTARQSEAPPAAEGLLAQLHLERLDLGDILLVLILLLLLLEDREENTELLIALVLLLVL